MHDLQALQKGIYGRRLVSPRDIAVLDRVRGAGIENVAFQTRDPEAHAR